MFWSFSIFLASEDSSLFWLVWGLLWCWVATAWIWQRLVGVLEVVYENFTVNGYRGNMVTESDLSSMDYFLNATSYWGTGLDGLLWLVWWYRSNLPSTQFLVDGLLDDADLVSLWYPSYVGLAPSLGWALLGVEYFLGWASTLFFGLTCFVKVNLL